jgi:hypothetical protein
MSYNGTHTVVESFEDRQWRQMLDEAKKRLLAEEDEWAQLLARAHNALENEEREWQRLRTRADVKSSGAFPAQPPARSVPAARRAVGAPHMPHMPARPIAPAAQPFSWP